MSSDAFKFLNEMPPSWSIQFPAPKSTPGAVTHHDVLTLLKQTTQSQASDFVLVDLRRNDHQGGTIRGSINLPAQSLYPSIPTLYKLFNAAGIKKVIWYCNSSGGRGPRAAAWFADHIAEHPGSEMQSLVLTGGIAGWVTAGDEFVKWTDGYGQTS